ncbi:MAG: DUF3892 domain-containing protein [Spirochaetales bacterium]|jgi:hypothetical protein|nr:DUF3892 domain-containing protein [Spirochaetales bacterium]
MSERKVTRTRKDKDGDILALCNPGDFWSPRAKADAINDIESGTHSYYVPWSDGTRTPIKVVSVQNGKYLRTDKDSTPRNNLNDLQDC